VESLNGPAGNLPEPHQLNLWLLSYRRGHYFMPYQWEPGYHLHQGCSCSHWWCCVRAHTGWHTQGHTPCSRM